MAERNLAATARTDVDVDQPLWHLPNAIELMCINMIWQSGRSVLVCARTHDRY